MDSSLPYSLPPSLDFRHVLLDLGGVLLDIDYDASVKAFQGLGIADFDGLYSQAKQSKVFDEFECGRMSPERFRTWVRSHQRSLTDDAIDLAWNSMLIGLRAERLQWLQELSTRYPLHLLSNTNEIHIQAFEAMIEQRHGLERFKNCFQGYFYSSRIGRRKPHPATFHWALEQQGIPASQCLFIDDSPQHVQGALDAGLKAVYLAPGRQVEELFLAIE